MRDFFAMLVAGVAIGAVLIFVAASTAALPAPNVGDPGAVAGPCNYSNLGRQITIFAGPPNWYAHFTCTVYGWRRDWIRQL